MDICTGLITNPGWWQHSCYSNMILCYRYSWRTPYGDVIMSAMASQSPASRVFAQPIVRVHIKENIKFPRHWPLWVESTGDRCIPLTNTVPVCYSWVYSRLTKHGGRETRGDLQMVIVGKLRLILNICWFFVQSDYAMSQKICISLLCHILRQKSIMPAVIWFTNDPLFDICFL